MTVTEMPEYTQNKTALETSVKIQGNLDADKVKMTVSQDGAAHIMSLLTDLYSDPNLAVLREYSSNAIDSHKEVLGKMPPGSFIRPVEITLPSSLSSNFVVQDFGTGMSTDDIRDIYSSYGKSTKQRDFNQIGAFGLGCKSALTLTQQFTLNSVKDGQKTVAIISRGEDGVGEVNIVSSTETTESNGVKVTIPIPRRTDFLGKVNDFFYTWETGTVLVDGKQPPSLESDGYAKSKSGMFWYAFNNTRRPNSSGTGNPGFNLILGGISYPMSFTDVWGYDSYYGDGATPRATANTGSFYIEIPIGSVDLTPSREGLRYSPRTVKFLKELTTTVSNEVLEMSTDEIKNAPSRKDALINSHKFSQYRRNFKKATQPKWNGEAVPESIDVSALQIKAAPSYARARINKYQITHFRLADYLLSEKKSLVIIKVADPTEAGRVSRNAYDYLQSLEGSTTLAGPDYVTILATQADIDSPWVLETDVAEFVDYEDFLEIAKQYRKDNKDPSASRTKANPITYKVIERLTDTKGDVTFTFNSLKPSEISPKAMYVKSSDSGASGLGVFRSLISAGSMSVYYSNIFKGIWDVLGLTDKDQIVVLEKNKTVEALNKRVKTELRYFVPVVKESYKKFKESMEYEDKYFYSIMTNNNSLGKILRDLLILDKALPSMPDPEIVSILERYRRVSDVTDKINTYSMYIGMWDLGQADTHEQVDLQKKIDKLLESIPGRYPLLAIGQFYGNSGLDKNADHAMLYMKAVQESLNERKS